MKISKLSCYECGFEDFSISNSQYWDHCHACDSNFVENAILQRQANPALKNKEMMSQSQARNLFVNQNGMIYSRNEEKNEKFRKLSSEIDNMTGRMLTATESATCSICLEAISENTELKDLDNCDHKFHLGCIKQWAKVKNSCPTCTRIAFD